MAFQWMRRALLALAPAVLLALTACGSGSIESPFTPNRMVVFGDGLSDMGNTSNAVNAAARYTVNDTTYPMWVQQLAGDYGLLLAKSVDGGTNYATGNARVVLKPDAAGNSATPTIKEQIDSFLATRSFGDGDLVVIQGGIADIIVQMAAYRAGTISAAQMNDNLKQAGQDLAAQAQRLVAAGAKHVVVLGTYDLGTTPWAAAIGQKAVLSAASTAFNTGAEVALVNQLKDMLYVDVAGGLFNLMSNAPTGYGFTDSTTVVCTSVDPGPGIGIGTGQVNSALCTTGTIVPGISFSSYMWADPVYPAPLVHLPLGNHVYSRVHNRW